MKQTIITSFIVLVIVGLLSAIVWGSRSNQEPTSISPNKEIAEEASPIATSPEAPIFFYGNTCPHCREVEEWMAENMIEEKMEIVKKEVYDNRANSLELTQAAKSCGLPTDSIGVPFLYTTDKQCLVGTPDITAYLAKQVSEQEKPTEASESAERSQE